MEQPGHLLDLPLAGTLRGGGVAHHHPPHRRVTREKAGVDGDATLQPVEPAAEGCPVPVETRLQRLQRHALDPRQHAHQVGGVLAPGGCQAEAAVAADDGGDPVQRRRAGERIPEELGVVVGVRVDEARREHQPGGVDPRARGLAQPPGVRIPLRVTCREVRERQLRGSEFGGE